MKILSHKKAGFINFLFRKEEDKQPQQAAGIMYLKQNEKAWKIIQAFSTIPDYAARKFAGQARQRVHGFKCLRYRTG